MMKQAMSMRCRSARRAPAKLGATLLVTGGVALLGACSSGTSNSGGTATPAHTTPMTRSASPSVSVSVSAATCKHVSSLHASLESLTHLQLNASASTQIRKDLLNIQTQLTAIKNSGANVLSMQVHALSGSVTQVEHAAKNMSRPPTASQVTSVISALGALKSNSRASLSSMKAACPHS